MPPEVEKGSPLAFFHYLWKRKQNVVIGTSPLDTTPINVPHTVVYEHNFPRGWFSWHRGTDGPKRRVGKEIDSKAVISAFSKRSSHDPSIVASYIEKRVDTAGRETVAVEFFDAEELTEWITYGATLSKHGILQKFVAPTGKQNEVIQVTWSPHVCVIEKRQNVHHLNDVRVNTFERAVTYEGSTIFSRQSHVSPNTISDVRAVCGAIVEHLQIVEHKAVCRMTLYFKVDKENTLWLLWCSVLDLQDRMLDAPTRKVDPTFRTPQHYQKKRRQQKSELERLVDEEMRRPPPSMGPIADVYYQYINPANARRTRRIKPTFAAPHTRPPLQRSARPWHVTDESDKRSLGGMPEKTLSGSCEGTTVGGTSAGGSPREGTGVGLPAIPVGARPSSALAFAAPPSGPPDAGSDEEGHPRPQTAMGIVVVGRTSTPDITAGQNNTLPSPFRDVSSTPADYLKGQQNTAALSLGTRLTLLSSIKGALHDPPERSQQFLQQQARSLRDQREDVRTKISFIEALLKDRADQRGANRRVSMSLAA